MSAALFALLSGLLFGFAMNAYRHASLVLEPHHPFFAATGHRDLHPGGAVRGAGRRLLAVRQPAALEAVLTDWKRSLVAGSCGACASMGWVFALAWRPPPRSARWGDRGADRGGGGARTVPGRLSLGKLAAGGLTAIGVVLTALG